MRIVLDKNSIKPLNEQLYEQIASHIVNHRINAHEGLPSIRMLSKELGISVITVVNAYQLLESNNLVYMQGGKGCFVAPKVKEDNTKLSLARVQLDNDLLFYKNLGLSVQELIVLIQEQYDI